MASSYDDIIDDLAKNDPDFLNLSSDDQDRIVEDLAQERLGRIPKSENFLQRAIKSSRIGPFGGTSITAALPSDREEYIDLANVAGRQIPLTRGQGVGPAEMGPMGVGLNIAGIKEAGQIIPPPNTEYGRNLESSADIAPWVGLGLGGATKGVSNLINKFRSGPVKKNIEDLIFKGSGKVKSSVDDLFKSYNAKFGEQLDQLKSSMTTDDFSDLVVKSADEIGEFEPSRNTLLAQLENIIKHSSRDMNPRQVQSAMKTMIRSAGDTRAKAILHKNYLDKIPNFVPGLKELKQAHAPVYEAAKEAKTLGKGLMRKVASGRIGPEEMAAAKSAQSKLGIDVLSPLEKEGNKLQRIIRNQKVGKGLGALTGIGGGLLTILKALKKD